MRTRTRERQVCQLARAAVLSRDNVIANKSKLGMLRREMAVLTAISSALRNSLPMRIRHRLGLLQGLPRFGL